MDSARHLAGTPFAPLHPCTENPPFPPKTTPVCTLVLQEYLSLGLALLLALLEIVDYVGWSREAYHRRLCMEMSPAFEPYLYPIPGANVERCPSL